MAACGYDGLVISVVYCIVSYGWTGGEGYDCFVADCVNFGNDVVAT